MSNEYIGVVTLAGQAAIAGSIGGTPLSLTTVRVGDGNGVPITPNETMTDLVRRVGAGYGIAASGRDPVNPTMWRITAVIPAADGPFDIREIGVFDAAGTLIALAKHPFVEKRSPAQGNAVELTTDIVFPISDTAQITINLLPDVAVHVGQMLRAPFLVVDSATTTAPPASPAVGATYVIPSTGATGAWSGAGLANRLAQWTGEVWAAVDVPMGHVVVARDKGLSDPLRYLSRTAAGWGEWVASADHLGLVELGTLAEVLAGADAARVPSLVGLAVAVQRGRWAYAEASGTANAWTVTFTPAPTALAELIGVPLRIFVTATPTGAVTLAVNGLPATALGDADGWALPVGYVHAGNLLTVVFDGSVFRIMAGARPTCVPFSLSNAASQAIPNSVWTQISPGADATYPNVGALSGGVFTFTRGGLYIVSFDATLVASVVGANQIQSRVTAKIGGISIAGTAPGDSNYGAGTGSYAANISVVTAVVAGTGSALTIEAQISANSNYTAGACNSLGLAIWPIN